MLNYVKKIFVTVVKSEYRFVSRIHKSKTRIITADQQLVEEIEDVVNDKKHKRIGRGRKSISFLESYEGKSIESVDDEDIRFSCEIINARNLSNDDNEFLVLEGVNSISDAIKLQGSMITLFFTLRELLHKIPYTGQATNAKVYYVTYENMKKFSNLTTPPGIMAIFKRPKPESMITDVFLSNKLPLTLILDNIKDPGTLGTIIRTAAGFNLNKILLSHDCVHLYHEKVIRSAMSSLFCVPTFDRQSWTTIGNSLHPDCTVYCSDISHNSESITDALPYYNRHLVDFTNNKTYGLIIGGDSTPLCQAAKYLSETMNGCQLIVPTADSTMYGLNTAMTAAILISEFQKIFLMSK